MEIRGNKVILRTMEEQDQEMLLGLIQDQEITRVTGGYSSPSSYEPQIQWPCSWEDSADSLRSIIADKENPEIGLGIILLSHVDPQNGIAELSIKLGKSVRGMGYGQDAVNIMVSYGFRELGLNSICSHILESNTASRRLFEKCGFRQNGLQKGRTGQEGHCRSVCVYIIKKEDISRTSVYNF